MVDSLTLGSVDLRYKNNKIPLATECEQSENISTVGERSEPFLLRSSLRIGGLRNRTGYPYCLSDFEELKRFIFSDALFSSIVVP